MIRFHEGGENNNTTHNNLIVEASCGEQILHVSESSTGLIQPVAEKTNRKHVQEPTRECSKSPEMCHHLRNEVDAQLRRVNVCIRACLHT